MRIDLGFADLAISFSEIEVKGKRGATVREEGMNKEVPPASGTVRVAMERFIEAVGLSLVPGVKGLRRREEEDGEVKIVPEKPVGAQGQEEEAKAAVEGGAGSGAETREDTSSQLQTAGDSGEERRVFRFRGGDGLSLIVAPARAGVWISVAKRQDGKIVEKSAGLVRPTRAMVLADLCGKAILSGRVIKPMARAILVASKGEVSFMDGSIGTTLEPHQKLELYHFLTAKLLGSDLRLNFRAGRLRLREQDGEFRLAFGRNEGPVSPGDLMLLRSVCVPA